MARKIFLVYYSYTRYSRENPSSPQKCPHPYSPIHRINNIRTPSRISDPRDLVMTSEKHSWRVAASGASFNTALHRVPSTSPYFFQPLYVVLPVHVFAYARSMEYSRRRSVPEKMKRVDPDGGYSSPGSDSRGKKEKAARKEEAVGKRARRKEEEGRDRRKKKRHGSNTGEQSQTGRRWARRPCSKQSCNSALAPRGINAS